MRERWRQARWRTDSLHFIRDASGHIIADLPADQWETGAGDLMAAAPDLLRALSDVVDMVERVRGFWQAQGCIAAGMPGRSDEERVTGWAAVEIARRAIARAEGRRDE